MYKSFAKVIRSTTKAQLLPRPGRMCGVAEVASIRPNPVHNPDSQDTSSGIDLIPEPHPNTCGRPASTPPSWSTPCGIMDAGPLCHRTSLIVVIAEVVFSMVISVGVTSLAPPQPHCSACWSSGLLVFHIQKSATGRRGAPCCWRPNPEGSAPRAAWAALDSGGCPVWTASGLRRCAWRNAGSPGAMRSRIHPSTG